MHLPILSDQERIDNDIVDLCRLSSTVNTYISTQSYLSKYGPEGTSDANILIECYVLIEEELKELGIYLDDDDIYDDFWSLKSLYAVRQLFDSETLSFYCSRDKELKEALIHCANTSNDLFNDCLDLLLERYDNDSLVTMAEELWMRCHSDRSLTDHILAVCEDKYPPCTLVDAVGVKSYLDFIIKGRVDVAEAIKRAIHVFPWLNDEHMKKLVDDYDMDKINTDTIAMYTLFDKEDEPLPIPLEAMGKRWMDAHHMRIPHHIEYWLAHPQMHATYQDLAILVGHHWHPETADKDFLAAVEKLIDQGASVLTEDDITMIHSLSQAMLRAL